MPRKNNTPPHQIFHFASNCQQKRRYVSERIAESTAEHQMLINQDLELSVYKCDQCGGWHLTRRPKRK